MSPLGFLNYRALDMYSVYDLFGLVLSMRAATGLRISGEDIPANRWMF